MKHITIDNLEHIPESATFQDLRYLHGTGRSKTSIGAYGRKHSDYRFGAQTEIGDIEISVWEAAMHRLIQKSGEEEFYQALLAWVEADTPWLHTKRERELYALELHSARIFELPEWVAKQEFEENYMPKSDQEGTLCP